MSAIKRSFEDEWEGIGGVVAGLRRCIDLGEVAVFVIADNPRAGDNTYARYAIAKIPPDVIRSEELSGAWRLCGEDDDPIGVGSELLAFTSIEEAVGRFVMRTSNDCISTGAHIFRQENE